MAPRITVAMPVFNGARFLRQAIDSLLAQTRSDFELICLDDASTDDSAAIASSTGDPRVSVVASQQHTSLPVNWNRALDAANGEYVVVAHQDDVYDPRFLETASRLLDEHPRTFAAHTKSTAIDEHGAPVSLPAAMYKERFWPADDPYEREPADEFCVLIEGNYIIAPAVMLRTIAIRDIGHFDPRYHFVTDWEYWLRGLRRGYTITGTHARLVGFRRHSDTATRASELTMRRYEEEREMLISFGVSGRMRPIENTLLNDFADRLAAGDVTGARRLVAYGEEQLPRFRGSARDRVMRVALRGGRAGGRALAWLRQSWIRAAVVTHRFYN